MKWRTFIAGWKRVPAGGAAAPCPRSLPPPSPKTDAEGARAQWRRSLTTCAQSYLSLPPSWTRPRQMTATDWPSAVALQQSDTLSLYGGA